MFRKAAAGLVLVAVLSVVGQPIPAEGESLTVLTINVWSGLDYRGSFKMGECEEKDVRRQRTQALLDGLRELSPDVLSLRPTSSLAMAAGWPRRWDRSA